MPVKALESAKSRLAPILTPAERRTLVLTMLGDVLAALASTPQIDRVGVISSDPTVLAQAALAGAQALQDWANDLNGALTQAAQHYAAAGCVALLVLPADVPLVTPDELAALLQANAPGVTLAPARDGGTNALLARPPQAIPFCFGVGSLDRHLAAAQAQQIEARLFHAAGLELDVDRSDDLLALAERPITTATQRLARELQLAERYQVLEPERRSR